MGLSTRPYSCILRLMIDLHTHSDASDGELSPTALIEMAAREGVTALALTDHDTIAPLKEAFAAAQNNHIRFIPGVEIEVAFNPGEFHLLGLNIQDWNGELASFLETIRDRRVERNRKIVSRMNAAGYSTTLNELEARAGGDVMGRMHIAQWLVEKKHAKNVPDAFKKFLAPSQPFYAPKILPDLEQALSVISRSGGKPVIAHPLSLWISWGRMAGLIPEWKELGLQGIEAYHSGASLREAARFQELADRNGMFVTGGSDFHGTGRPDRCLGYGAGGKKLKESMLDVFDS